MPKDEIGFEEIKTSLGEVNKAFEEFKTANNERLDQLEQKGSEDPVLIEKLEKINGTIDEHDKKLSTYAARMKQLSTTDGKSEEDLDKKARQWAKPLFSRKNKVVPEEFGAKDLSEYKDAFERFLREEEKTLSLEDVKALSVGQDPDGGYTVYPDMNGRIVDRVYETSPVRQYASVTSISTDALEGTQDLEEADAGWVGETAQRPETNTPQLGVWRIPVHEIYAKPKATQKILDDSAVDIEAWLSNKVADKFARMENTAFVSGNGTNKPRGFNDYPAWTAQGTYQLNAIEEFVSGADGAFVAAPNGGDIFIDVLYSMKMRYRANAVWFMNRSTMAAVRKLKDSDGAYLWQPGIQAGQPSTIIGHGVVDFDDMPDLGTDSLSIVCGDMGAAYQIVDRVGIRVLRDPFSEKPYIQFYSTKRVGGDVIDFDAIKRIRFNTT